MKLSITVNAKCAAYVCMLYYLLVSASFVKSGVVHKLDK